MAGTRTGFGSDIYNMGRDSFSIQENPKTESCVGAACKKLSKAAKNIKNRFTRKKSRERLLPRMSDLDKEIRFSDLSDYQGTPSFTEYDQLGGRRKRRRRRTRKKKGGKRRRTRKKRKSRKRRKKRKSRKRRKKSL